MAPTTEAPTRDPTQQPTPKPTAEPSWAPTPEPTAEPTESPTATPTRAPTPEPTAKPTTARPTVLGETNPPTDTPTLKPSASPSQTPTPEPTESPTATPTRAPTPGPTAEPSTARPTVVGETNPPTPIPTVDLRPTAEPTLMPSRDPAAPEPTSHPTTAVRTHVTYEVDHTLQGIDAAAFGCLSCPDAMAAAVTAAVPSAKIRAASFVLVYSRDAATPLMPARRRRLAGSAVDLRYRGSFVAEDTGISGVAAAFAAVKHSFEETVQSGNFTRLLHAASRTWGAASFRQVTSSMAVMRLVSGGGGTVGGGGGESETQNLGFFEGLPTYGKWFFSLGMIALGLGASWLYYRKVHGGQLAEDKFKGIDAVEEESGVAAEWGSSHHGAGMVVETPLAALGEPGADDADASAVKVKHMRHTPLSTRTASMGREHRFITPMVSPLPASSTPSSPASLNIVDVTSAAHLDIAGESDDDELYFGY